MQTKICTKCNQEKNISEFFKQKTGKFGVLSYCKICKKIYSQSDIAKESKKKYQLSESYLKSQKKYRLSKSYKKCQKNQQKKRYYSDINFKMKMVLRSRFFQALKNNRKSGSAVKMLGCSIEEFKNYFESLFIEGMNWEKVFDGSIHIDHKRPLASFDLSIPENQAKACHYTNLQPLWAVDNLKKSDSWI